MPQLLDVSKLRWDKYDKNRSALKDDLSPIGRAQVAPKSPTCRLAVGPVFENDSEDKEPINGKSLKNAHLDHEEKPDSPHGSAPAKGNGSGGRPAAAAVGEAD